MDTAYLGSKSKGEQSRIECRLPAIEMMESYGKRK